MGSAITGSGGIQGMAFDKRMRALYGISDFEITVDGNPWVNETPKEPRKQPLFIRYIKLMTGRLK